MGRVRRRVGSAPNFQQRITQSWAKESRPEAAASDAFRSAPPGSKCDAANDAGNANQPERGDERIQPVGRPFVIHILRKGFLFVGVGPDEKLWLRRLMGCAALSSCVWPACAGTPGVTWVQAAGSGSSAAANWGRREDPAIRATNMLSATMAMVNRHRRVSTGLGRPTVAPLYDIGLVQ